MSYFDINSIKNKQQVIKEEEKRKEEERKFKPVYFDEINAMIQEYRLAAKECGVSTLLKQIDNNGKIENKELLFIQYNFRCDTFSFKKMDPIDINNRFMDRCYISTDGIYVMSDFFGENYFAVDPRLAVCFAEYQWTSALCLQSFGAKDAVDLGKRILEGNLTGDRSFIDSVQWTIKRYTD